MPKKTALQAVVDPLLSWYRENRREMPWRNSPSPYHVWVSEIMLQQTRIEAVKPYYERFLEAFPTVADLAAADDDRLMKLWEGLGYYSRVRNLKKAALTVMDRYGGVLPDTAAELRQLAGIGDYTAGAIASIAYGKAEPAVDGNVLRVFARLRALSEDIMAPATRKSVTEALRAVYPEGGAAGELTEGLMELGETVCIPNGIPLCDRCPLRHLCEAHRKGEEDRYPVRTPKKERRSEKKTVFLLLCEGKYALRRRGEKGLLASLWEFPNIEGHLSAKEIPAALRAFGLTPLSVKPCGTAKHIFTHVEWHMTGYEILCESESPDFVWETAEEIRRAYAIPTAFRAYEKILRD